MIRKRIYELAREGKSVGEIAARLTDEGFKRPRGEPLKSGHISSHLSNIRLNGHRLFVKPNAPGPNKKPAAAEHKTDTLELVELIVASNIDPEKKLKIVGALLA